MQGSSAETLALAKEHYDTSVGFVVVDENLGGGIAVGSSHMEDEGEAELQVSRQRAPTIVVGSCVIDYPEP